jgi:hypothetical protein
MTKYQLDQLRYGHGEGRKQGTSDVSEELLRRMRSRRRGKKPSGTSLID